MISQNVEFSPKVRTEAGVLDFNGRKAEGSGLISKPASEEGLVDGVLRPALIQTRWATRRLKLDQAQQN